MVGQGQWVVHNCGEDPEAGTWWRDSSLNDAPKQTTPGTKTLEGVHVNDLGVEEGYQAHYDQWGRQIGRTDYTRGNLTQGIPEVHHHAYFYDNTYFSQGIGLPPALDHMPGEFTPSTLDLFWLL